MDIRENLVVFAIGVSINSLCAETLDIMFNKDSVKTECWESVIFPNCAIICDSDVLSHGMKEALIIADLSIFETAKCNESLWMHKESEVLVLVNFFLISLSMNDFVMLLSISWI